MVAKPKKIVNGDDLLYRFFHSLMKDRPDLASDLLSRMFTSMGIWFPLDLYRELPVLLPWVVRDPSCRGDKKKSIADQWAAPDQDGYLRDDNSLIKSLVRSLEVKGAALTQLHGAKLGTEFVASHVWRVVNHSKLASRHPLLNSFVPNLVWLPKQVSKLTDREGEVMQRGLQAMAWSIYRSAPVAPHLQPIVDECWSLIPEPTDVATHLDDLNTFIVTEKYLFTRRARLRSVIETLQLLEEGKAIPTKVIASRYTAHLPEVGQVERSSLKAFLERFEAPPAAS